MVHNLAEWKEEKKRMNRITFKTYVNLFYVQNQNDDELEATINLLQTFRSFAAAATFFFAAMNL